MDKSPDAFRTISEVADWLDTPAHVLRFWESRFTQVKPVKRAGGRRYYRPSDMALLGGIKKLLHDDGMTIRGVQKLLREHGVKYVASLSPVIEGVEPITAPTPEHSPIPPVPSAPMAEMVPQDDFEPTEPEKRVIPFARPDTTTPPTAEVASEERSEDLTPEASVANAHDSETPAAAPAPVAGGRAGQTSFDFDHGPMADLFEKPDPIEADEDITEDDIEFDTTAESATDDAEMTAEDEAILTAGIGTIEPEIAEETSEEPYVATDFSPAEATASVGREFALPEDPSDDDDITIMSPGIVGQLNHRKLCHVSQHEIAALLSRVEALRARIAG
ncbi:MerR family transcriptional regulator [Celeribacter persicus]|uniref:MerR-like DNA binding protein n=1 Tax=Celeribacter persicus TaxID=1651082 RepID=A0A2T5HUK0_9RHOB|nr:MerR family transcriptional regulator [Celeribacter persicus]PTQ75267.1 MerR-like DNA binding protein [Celeribacter persicus]